MIIDGKKIIADEGKVLIRIADNLIKGKQFTLGYTFWLNHRVLPEPKQEYASDYTEITDEELSERIIIDSSAIAITAEESKDYGTLVDTLVKIKYSPEDQIAVLCNYQLNSNDDNYIKEYNEMQEWRKLSKLSAKNYLERKND